MHIPPVCLDFDDFVAVISEENPYNRATTQIVNSE